MVAAAFGVNPEGVMFYPTDLRRRCPHPSDPPKLHGFSGFEGVVGRAWRSTVVDRDKWHGLIELFGTLQGVLTTRSTTPNCGNASDVCLESVHTFGFSAI